LEKPVSGTSRSLSTDDLIPLETCSREMGANSTWNQTPRLIVGHNVSFDRSFIKEQYFVQVKVSCICVTFNLCTSKLLHIFKIAK